MQASCLATVTTFLVLLRVAPLRGELPGGDATKTGKVPIVVTATCAPATGPGKIRCDVAVTATAGKLGFTDIAVLSAPDFAPALRSRLGPEDATRREDGGIEFVLALLAKSTGVGQVRVAARAVVCGTRGCLPFMVEATAGVTVSEPSRP